MYILSLTADQTFVEQNVEMLIKKLNEIRI